MKPLWPKKPKALRKDLDTLLRFRALGYRRALYLLYGIDPRLAAQRIGRHIPQAQLAAMEIWVHAATGAPAIRIA